MSKSKLSTSLSKLAQTVVDQALEPDVDLDTRLDVLKTAGTFFVNTTKAKTKTPEDDPETPTFGKFKESIHGAGNGEIGHG